MGSGNIITTGRLTITDILLENSAIIANKKNIDIDIGTETVDSFADTLGDSATWLYLVKNGDNRRAGMIIACWNDSNDTTEYNEVTTLDIGNTSDVTFEVDINSNTVRLRTSVLSNNWEVRVIRLLV